MLTDSEVLALENVLVRDNESLTHIRFTSGTYGAGNTNTSKWNGEDRDVAIEKFDGQPIRSYRFGIRIAAAVEDVLYLVVNNTVKRLRLFQSYSETQGIAYDTYEQYMVTAVSTRTVTLVTEQGIYIGNVVDGKPEGRGTYEYVSSPDGRVFADGYFLGGVLQNWGTIKYADGGIYKGQIKDGVPDERGEYQYPNGQYYKGYFSEGKPHGSGVLYSKSGKVKHNGWWKNGEIHK